jgi:hypothetical protein
LADEEYNSERPSRTTAGKRKRQASLVFIEHPLLDRHSNYGFGFGSLGSLGGFSVGVGMTGVKVGVFATGLGLGVKVGVFVGVGVAVGLAVTVGVGVGVGVAVPVGNGTDVDVSVGVVVRVKVDVGVGVLGVSAAMRVGKLDPNTTRHTPIATTKIAGGTRLPASRAGWSATRALGASRRESWLAVISASRKRTVKSHAREKRSPGALASILSKAASTGSGISGRSERGDGTGLCPCALSVPGVLPGNGTRPVSIW